MEGSWRRFSFFIFGFSPTQRGANSDTHRYPYGFFGYRKHDGPGCRAYADPVTRIIKSSLFFSHCVLGSPLFNRDAFGQIARLIDISAPRYGHVIRQ